MDFINKSKMMQTKHDHFAGQRETNREFCSRINNVLKGALFIGSSDRINEKHGEPAVIVWGLDNDSMFIQVTLDRIAYEDGRWLVITAFPINPNTFKGKFKRFNMKPVM